MTLADFDNQRMQLVGMASGFFASGANDRAVPQGLQICIACVRWKKFVPRHHAAKVFIDNEYRMFKRVQKNGVCSLRADSGQCQ